ncbi:MAG: hypothetical protein GKR88_08595 [Flavobacteriaceae bacterium]|nr:MAG: hypothetical protein GKR88_08595 [Flavobacteriaceae bacterium]
MTHFFNHKTIIFVLCLLSIGINNAQKWAFESKEKKADIPVITGKESVHPNDRMTYEVIFPRRLEVGAFEWSVDADAGKLITYTKSSAVIQWHKTGEAKIYYDVLESSSGRMQSVYHVNIIRTAIPNPPPPPTILSQNCTRAVLQKTGTIPQGEMWYWQGTNKYGTDTSLPATDPYTVTTSGTYRIRARNTATGSWSLRGSSVSVTLSTIGGPTWYADSDEDGLGDPGNTIVQCTQPEGYVSDDSDRCPYTNGNGSTTGCPPGVEFSNMNYIYTITPQKEVSDISQITKKKDAVKQVVYFDGLGRPIQNIAVNQSASSNSIITHIDYDAFGRQSKEYLPYDAGDDLSFYDVNSKVKTEAFYNIAAYQNTTNPYSKKSFDDSPLNRVLKQAAPGNDWAMESGHEIRFDYYLNMADEVRLYTVSLDSNLKGTLQHNTAVNNGYYAAGTLFKTVTKDENWTTAHGHNHTTEEFKNKSGQVVLKRAYNNGQKHDTYYIYDDYGNLSFVLPPKMEAGTAALSTVQNALDHLAYRYTYDTQKRLVKKKIPGKGEEVIIYDKLNRPVLTQDARQKPLKQWLFNQIRCLWKGGLYRYLHPRFTDQSKCHAALFYQSKYHTPHASHSLCADKRRQGKQWYRI